MPNNPSYYQTVAPIALALAQLQEHHFHIYLHQQYGKNETNIVPPRGHVNSFGCTNVYDYDLLDAPRVGATIIGRLQGLGTAAGLSSEYWHNSANLVFIDQRFQGSTLSVQGRLGPARLPDQGDWAVVGGTGEFAYAQGTMSYKRIHQDPKTGFIIDLDIRVKCLTVSTPKPATKVGPWGGNGGTAYEIDASQLPQRLDSLTIYDNGNFVESIEFSYTDQAGHNRTVGAWGGDNGKYMNPEIQLGASETLNEVYGSTGSHGGRTVVTSLTIVTSATSYGPYGKQSRGDTPFHVAAPNGQSIAGFYGRADGQAVNQIGAYVV